MSMIVPNTESPADNSGLALTHLLKPSAAK